MVAHKNIAMHLNWIEIYTRGKNLHKFTPVIIVAKDFTLLVPATRNVVPGTGVFYADRSDHSTSLSDSDSI